MFGASDDEEAGVILASFCGVPAKGDLNVFETGLFREKFILTYTIRELRSNL
jgi:hypothetical protein